MRATLLLALSAWLLHVGYSQNTPLPVTVPSNDSSDLLPASSSPRFLLNGTEFPDLPVISLAPLGLYTQIPKSQFVEISVQGHLVNVNVDNSNEIVDREFAYISCDPEAYSGYLNASNALNNALYSGVTDFIIILYSRYSNHCNVSNLSSAPEISGILTTVNPMAAGALARLDLSASAQGEATILPDLNSYTNTSGQGNFGDNGNLLGPSPTTAVAMIILYAICGTVCSLFLVIIISGAVRAHRHPERYGPRTIAGRVRQSRAKGIARAMLETLPIVKFGDHTDLPTKPADGAVDTSGTRDIEMTPTPGTKAPAHDATTTEPAIKEPDGTAVVADAAPHDGSSEDGTLGCSICTEDFTKGEEVRVLPCNHKFHPDCVDPWLLNVSGTCPLCRIDLRPEEERTEEDISDNLPPGEGSLNIPPPLALFNADGTGRRGTTAGLRGAAHGTRDERIAALRRYRQERRRTTNTGDEGGEGAGGSEVAEEQADRRGLSARMRERLRVRTTRFSEGMERLQRAI